LGGATYTGAPPLENFESSSGNTVISRVQIKDGEEVFHLRGLMAWGSFWGDGAERGPDFTADALHRTAISMRRFYAQEVEDNTGQPASQYDEDAIAAKVIRELHNNTYDEDSGIIHINEAQIFALKELNEHYTSMFTDADYSEAFDPAGYISDPTDIENLTAFFFWGGWVAAANRPGEDYSYTHNWPGDKAAGNTPTSATFMWSLISIFALILGVSLVLYIYGQMKDQEGDIF